MKGRNTPPSRRAARHARTKRGLDRRWVYGAASPTPPTGTAPRPASGDADQTPLGREGRGNVNIIRTRNKVKRTIGRTGNGHVRVSFAAAPGYRLPGCGPAGALKGAGHVSQG